MPKFKVGDIVRVVEVHVYHINKGVQVGDIFEVTEDSRWPYCRSVTSLNVLNPSLGQITVAFRESQLKLVTNKIDPVQQELNELHILLSAQDKKIARLEEIIENQKKVILKLAE